MTAHVEDMTATAFVPIAYLWEDAETTGLSEENDLLEISVIATDKDLNELESFTTIIRPQMVTFEQLHDNTYVEAMHARSGLLDDLYSHGAHAPTEKIAEQAIIDLIDRHSVPDNGPIRLAGGGVARFDYPYLEHRMPALIERLHYRTLDVSVMAQAYTDATGSDLFGEKKDKAHRAEADIREDLDRGRAFWRMFRGVDAQQHAHPALDGTEAVLAGTEIIRAFDASDDAQEAYAGLRALLDGTSEAHALAGVTAIASHLATVLADRTGLSVEDVLAATRRDLIRTGPQVVGAPRM